MIESVTQPAPPGPRILVVDDEPDVVEMLRKYISLTGFAVDTALNGGEALMLLQATRPDVILLDIKMPGMDGVEVLKHIRAVDPTIRVIMVTSIADVNLAQVTLKAGAFDYVTKPIDFDYLDRAIVTALETDTARPGRTVATAIASEACGQLTDALRRVVSQMTGPARLSLPERLEGATLAATRDAIAGNAELAARALRQVQILLRACAELGDLPAEHRSRLEAALSKAQMAVVRASQQPL